MRAYLFRVLTMLSCLLNAIVLGKAYQSFSVRNWDRKRRGLIHIVPVIDFFLGEDHCLESWVTWRIARGNTKKVRKEYKDGEEKYRYTQW